MKLKRHEFYNDYKGIWRCASPPILINMICLSIFWWRRAILQSAVHPAPYLSVLPRTPAPGAGLARTNPNAGFTLMAGNSCRVTRLSAMKDDAMRSGACLSAAYQTSVLPRVKTHSDRKTLAVLHICSSRKHVPDGSPAEAAARTLSASPMTVSFFSLKCPCRPGDHAGRRQFSGACLFK